jgi:processive 1,2-diacylglycerol beta-glucosyltransferase
VGGGVLDLEKKIVILYASAGHGHQKAAFAVLDAYQEKHPGHRAQAIDTIFFAHPFFGKLYTQTYYFQIKYVPWLWGFFYYLFDVPFVYFFVRLARRILNWATARGLEAFLIKENPDVVISTHFLSTEVASHLKEAGKIRSKLVTVVTDYLPHFVWTAKNVDCYAVALEETRQGLIHRGVDAKKISVLGIPVEKKFLKTHHRPDIRHRLGLERNAFTVLITSGGVGIGAIESVVDEILSLCKSIHVLAVCGTNRHLFERLEKTAVRDPFLKVFGFVNNMDELMEAADLVIGKGGGLTITESFVRHRPVLLFRSVPGQETRNALCVTRSETGLATDSLKELKKRVGEFADQPEKLEALRQNVVKISKPSAANAIVELAERGN